VQALVVAVLRAAHRDDRLERGWPPHRRLDRREGAPGLAEQRDGPAAPGLRRDPGDHLAGVVLLARLEFLRQHPVAVARAVHVDAQRRVAARREPRMDGLVARPRRVALAVGHVLDDRRRGPRARIRRKPEPRREAPAIRERDPGVLGRLDGRAASRVAHAR